MPRALTLFLAALVSLTAPQAGRAWGIAGHAIVAEIAEAHLTPAALAESKRLLAEEGWEHLAEVASWADEIRPLRKEANPWHYVDIPLAAAGYQPSRDCPKDDCAIAAITRFQAILADKRQPDLDRREALKFLVHFVGDLQMPLHAAENAGDHGGNKVPVRYFDQSQGWGDRQLSLHMLWDAAILERHLGVKEGKPGEPNTELLRAAGQLAAQLDRGLGREQLKAQSLDPVSWAMESHDIAAKIVYPGVVAAGAEPSKEPVALGEDYDRRAWPVVQQRLQLGGLRLAALLNQALTP